MTRLFINFGKMDNLFPNKLIELINKCVPGRVNIGKIDLLPKFSFFDVAEEDAQDVVDSMNQYEIEGRQISVEFADKVENRGGRGRGGSRRNSSRRERPVSRRKYGDDRRSSERGGGERRSSREGSRRRKSEDRPFYDRYGKGSKGRR